MEPRIEREGVEFVVYMEDQVHGCQTEAEAKAIADALRVFHSPNPHTEQRVRACLDQLAKFGHRQDNSLLARQVASRLEDAEKRWI